MKHEFTAIFERDGDWYIGYCPEIPGANGQGKSKEEARQSLAEAIALILQDRREDALRSVPDEAEHPGGIPNLPDWVTREAYSLFHSKSSPPDAHCTDALPGIPAPILKLLDSSS